MSKFSVVFLVIILVSSGTVSRSNGMCTKTNKKQCPFVTGSDLVTIADLEQKVDNVHWLKIYFSEFSTSKTFGKCNFRWASPDSENIVKTELMCYNSLHKRCEDYGASYTRSPDECNRAVEYGVNITVTAKFYSQDLDEYVLHDICFGLNDDGECPLRYLNLLVKSSRFYDTDGKKKDALDLERLPWHLISADMKINFGFDFSSDFVKFGWEGPDCGFDGKLRQN